MESNLELAISFALLLGYTYTLTAAHIVLARIDKQVEVPRARSGAISVSALAEISPIIPTAKKAILLLRVNSCIIYIFIVLLVFSIFFGKTVFGNLSVSIKHINRSTPKNEISARAINR